jgi:hypothetical protein
MLTILSVCFFAGLLSTLHTANVAYVMAVLTERQAQQFFFCCFVWLCFFIEII